MADALESGFTNDGLLREGIFTGRTAIVTAAANGIGRSTVELLAGYGCAVVAADVDAGALEALAAEVTAAGGEILTVKCDVGDENSTAALFERWSAWRPNLDFVVNAVGVSHRGPLAEIEHETWRRTFHINLDSTLFICQLAYPHLARSQHAGVVNVGSVVARSAYPGAGAYGPSKAALMSVGNQLAMEWAPVGIRVNTVNPGVTRTPRMDRILTPETEASFISSTPLGRLVQPEEVAHTICFLLSDAASAITGQVLDVDCGLSQSFQKAPSRA